MRPYWGRGQNDPADPQVHLQGPDAGLKCNCREGQVRHLSWASQHVVPLATDPCLLRFSLILQWLNKLLELLEIS